MKSPQQQPKSRKLTQKPKKGKKCEKKTDGRQTEDTENKTGTNLEEWYRRSLEFGRDDVRWLIPKEDFAKNTFSTFADFVSEGDFSNLNNLMINLLHYVCERRVIRN